MRNTVKYFQYLSILLLFMASSCLKQQIGDYNPNGINDLAIDSTLDETYLLNVGDDLHLNADVLQTKPEGSGQLSYKWYYYPTAAYSTDDPVVVGEEAELNLKADMSTGEYYLVLEVTDESTGVKAYKKMLLTVKKLTSEGWLVLTSRDGKTDMSIVSSQNEVYQHFLTQNFPSNQRPVKLYCVNDWDEMTQTIVIQTDEPELYFIDFDNFDLIGTSAQTFSQDPGIKFKYFATDQYFNEYYLIDTDGAIYSTPRGPDPNFPEGFSQPFTGTYQLASLVMPTVTAYPVPVVVYDESAQRFLYQPYGESTLKSFGPAPVGAPFDLNNFPGEIIATSLGANDITYVVAKEPSGEIKVYSLDLNDALDYYPAESVATLDILNGKDPHFFTFSGKLPIVYFIDGQDLYVYKISENTATKLYTFPAGEDVAALQMLRETIMMTEAENPDVNNRIAVATNTSAGGVFYTFDLSPTGMLKTGQYTDRNEGFDFITDIAYKEQR